MNEQHKELAEQAGFDVYSWNENELEKFAALIVEDIAKVCESWSGTNTKQVARYIRQHFRVEE